MFQGLFQKPIHIRCDEISRWAEENTIKELEYQLPYIVEDIFGVINQVGWDLLNVEYTTNPQLYDVLFRFLHPSGPMIRLCYKLLSDPYIKYKFHLSFLPYKVRQCIEDGSASSFYMEKLEVDPRTGTPMHLALNPFELYMFHFIYHVVNPCVKSSMYYESIGYASLYLRLAEEYLSVFLPCGGSNVQPELPSHYVAQSAHRTVPPKPVRTSTLFRQDVLMNMLKQSPIVNTLQTATNVSIWRSELTAQLCIDLWLNMPNMDHQWGHRNPPPHMFGFQSTHDSPLPQVLLAQEQLPSSEHLNAVRLLVKHLHYFANSLVEDSSAIDELKRVIIPSSQQKFYLFTRQTMQHWPLDSSFKQILEIWLSYIQPWRYMDFKSRYNRPKGETPAVDSRWLPFVTENLLVYSEIFDKLKSRFKVIDLASSRNAYMLFRLTKVLAQPGLRELICKVESSLGDGSLGYSKWVRSHLMHLEGPTFQYKPICTPDSQTEDFLRTVKLAENEAQATLEEVLQREEKMGFWERFFSGGGIEYNKLNEQKHVPVLLSASLQNLCKIFQIPEESINVATVSAVNTTTMIFRSTNIKEMSPKQITKKLDELKSEGNPDLQPIRSYENAFLVRLFYHVCAWINYNYTNQFVSWYQRRDMVGGIVRQVLCGPTVIYHFDKRVPGVSARVGTSLPPRLSLRVLANYHLLLYIGLLFLLVKLVTGLSFRAFTLLFLFLWTVVMVVRWLLGYAPVAPTVSLHDISDMSFRQ